MTAGLAQYVIGAMRSGFVYSRLDTTNTAVASHVSFTNRDMTRLSATVGLAMMAGV